MTTMIQTKTEIRTAAKPGVFKRILHAVQSAEHSYRNQQKLQRTSDEHLRDMGLTRHEINNKSYLTAHRG